MTTTAMITKEIRKTNDGKSENKIDVKIKNKKNIKKKTSKKSNKTNKTTNNNIKFDKIKSGEDKYINVLYTNADTISNKFHEIESYISFYKADLVLITEYLSKICIK